MYEVGDMVCYPMHGAGIIVDIEKKNILGKSEEYFVVKIPIGAMKVMIPVKNAEKRGIRSIIEKEKLKDVVEVLKEEPTKMSTNWNKRVRDNTAILKEGDIFEVAKVYRNLKSLDDKRNLSTGEKKILHDAKNILMSEMILSSGKSYEEIDKIIYEAVE